MNWIKTMLAKWYLRSKGIDLGKVKAFLQGRKTQVLLVLGVVAGVYEWKTGHPIPEYIWIIWGSLTGITYKMGQNRTEARVKELLTNLEQDGTIKK